MTDPSRAAPRWLIPLALVLTGLSMRTAVTSVGAVLDDLRAGLHVGSGVAGVITTLPVVCFAAMGSAAPPLARRLGAQRLLVIALITMTVGLVARALASDIWLFLAFSVLALAGGAVSNVLMPSLVKRYFPARIGTMTAAYTTALAVGITAAAGLTVPIGHLGDGWRLGIGAWALLSAVAVLPWLALLRGNRTVATTARRRSGLVHSRLAWAIAIFFGAQSFQAYIAFGWFETFLKDHGDSSTQAGLLVAFFSAVSIPVSMVLPSLTARGNARALLIGLSACSLVAYAGMLAAPIGGSWVWMLLAGVGSGMFPLVLTVIGMRARTSDMTAALSAFAQGIGYLLAGTGPLLVGLLLGPSHNWSGPFVVLFLALAIATVAGWRSCGPGYIEDELSVPLVSPGL